MFNIFLASIKSLAMIAEMENAIKMNQCNTDQTIKFLQDLRFQSNTTLKFFTKTCNYWKKGCCKYGERCIFHHPTTTTTTVSTAPQPPTVSITPHLQPQVSQLSPIQPTQSQVTQAQATQSSNATSAVISAPTTSNAPQTHKKESIVGYFDQQQITKTNNKQNKHRPRSYRDRQKERYQQQWSPTARQQPSNPTNKKSGLKQSSVSQPSKLSISASTRASVTPQPTQQPSKTIPTENMDTKTAGADYLEACDKLTPIDATPPVPPECLTEEDEARILTMYRIKYLSFIEELAIVFDDAIPMEPYSDRIFGANDANEIRNVYLDYNSKMKSLKTTKSKSFTTVIGMEEVDCYVKASVPIKIRLGVNHNI